MNFLKFEDNKSFKTGLDNQSKNNLDEIEEDDLIKTHKEMFEYYKKNKNLNYYLILDDDPLWQKEIESLTKIFYSELNGIKNLETAEKDNFNEIIENIPQSKSSINSLKPKSTRKVTESSGNTKLSENQIFKKMKNTTYQHDCLDLDDLVKVDLPTEYNPDKHEELMRNLGKNLMNSRKKKTDYPMSNDDFNLLLCLMRKKKEIVYEKSPYYVDYSIKLKDVYVNEQFEATGKENDVNMVDEFVKKFIDNESNN